MKSLIAKRSVVIAGHKTSVSLEDAFWGALREIAKQRDLTLADLIAGIDADRQHGNLSSALRLFVLGFYRDRTERTDDRSGDFPPSRNTPLRAAEMVVGNGHG